MEQSLNIFEFLSSTSLAQRAPDTNQFAQITFFNFKTEANAHLEGTFTYKGMFGKTFNVDATFDGDSSGVAGGLLNLGEFDTLPLPNTPKYYGGTLSLHLSYGSQSLDQTWDVVDQTQLSGNISSTAHGTVPVIYFGNDGSNTVETGDGNDVLDGGKGIDAMSGGKGNDVYYVTTGDKVYEQVGQGDDIIITTSSYALTDGQSIETLFSYANKPVNLYGNDLAQTIAANTGLGAGHLYGRGGNDVLIATNGDDTLDGGGDTDCMFGGKGNDTYFVDNAKDKVTEDAGQGVDKVVASVSHVLSDYVENLTLTGKAAISGTGNVLANTIIGNIGANTLDGGLGNDILKGGSGIDTFVFGTALGAKNVDRITDFSVGKEMIHLDHHIFSALMPGEFDALQFKDITYGAKPDANDHILYNASKGAVYYDADGSGAGKAIAFAILDTHPTTLSAHDFFIV